MKPHERKQLPKGLYNLLLVEADAEDSILVWKGPYSRVAYTPLFVDGVLRAIFFSTQTQFVVTRLKVYTNQWPQDRIYINRTRLLRHCAKQDLPQLLIMKNQQAAENAVDPSRDPRPLWHHDTWRGQPGFSNIDVWTAATTQRINDLACHRASFELTPSHNMAILGVMLSVIASMHTQDFLTTGSFSPFDEIIGQEADAWLACPHNYAWNFPVLLSTDMGAYPYKSFIAETMVVAVPVLDVLPELQLAFSRYTMPPFWKGTTYVGYRAFKAVARRLFMRDWKRFALQLATGLPLRDPALAEFMSNVRLRSLHSPVVLGRSTPALLFPFLHPQTPACMKTLFQTRPLKHYSRWQLAELAVDMGWSLADLMFYYTDKEANRREVQASYNLYKTKPPVRNRCKIYMAKNICPYTTETYAHCCGVSAADNGTDLHPAQNFHRRLQIGYESEK